MWVQDTSLWPKLKTKCVFTQLSHFSWQIPFQNPLFWEGTKAEQSPVAWVGSTVPVPPAYNPTPTWNLSNAASVWSSTAVMSLLNGLGEHQTSVFAPALWKLAWLIVSVKCSTLTGHITLRGWERLGTKHKLNTMESSSVPQSFLPVWHQHPASGMHRWPRATCRLSEHLKY